MEIQKIQMEIQEMEMETRKVNRAPKQRKKRSSFSASQKHELGMAFKKSHYLTADTHQRLQEKLGVPKESIRVWFKNRRVKWRNETNSWYSSGKKESLYLQNNIYQPVISNSHLQSEEKIAQCQALVLGNNKLSHNSGCDEGITFVAARCLCDKSTCTCSLNKTANYSHKSTQLPRSVNSQASFSGATAMDDGSMVNDIGMTSNAGGMHQTQTHSSNPWMQSIPDLKGSLSRIHEGNQVIPEQNREEAYNRLDKEDENVLQWPMGQPTSKPIFSLPETKLQDLENSLLLDDLMAIIADAK